MDWPALCRVLQFPFTWNTKHHYTQEVVKKYSRWCVTLSKYSWGVCIVCLNKESPAQYCCDWQAVARSFLLWQDAAEWSGSVLGLEERQLLGGLAVKQNTDIINTQRKQIIKVNRTTDLTKAFLSILCRSSKVRTPKASMIVRVPVVWR